MRITREGHRQTRRPTKMGGGYISSTAVCLGYFSLLSAVMTTAAVLLYCSTRATNTPTLAWLKRSPNARVLRPFGHSTPATGMLKWKPRDRFVSPAGHTTRSTAWRRKKTMISRIPQNQKREKNLAVVVAVAVVAAVAAAAVTVNTGNMLNNGT